MAEKKTKKLAADGSLKTEARTTGSGMDKGLMRGIDLIGILVDGHADGDFYGRIVEPYDDRPIIFSSGMDLLKKMEELYDLLGYPEAEDRARTFVRHARGRKAYAEDNTAATLQDLQKDPEGRDARESEVTELATAGDAYRKNSITDGAYADSEGNVQRSESNDELIFYDEDDPEERALAEEIYDETIYMKIRLPEYILTHPGRDISKDRGREFTFFVLTTSRRKSTWQGEILYAEENKQKSFRSTLEFSMLMMKTILEA